MYRKIKELITKGRITARTIKYKDGNLLFEPEKILERWAEYVEELYNENNHEVDMQEVCVISEMEVEAVIQKN